MANINGDPVSLSLETLAAFIRTNVIGLTVLEEWPYANQKIAYPSITITVAGTPKRVPEMPYQIAKTNPDGDNKIVVSEVVASYDFSFQMDLWCRNKLERKQFTDKVISLFNSQEMDNTGNNIPDGLSLQCSQMFNEWIRYEIESYQPFDDEAGAQRQERREKFAVLVNFREVRQRTYYAIINTELHSDISATDELTDDLDNTEETDIF